MTEAAEAMIAAVRRYLDLVFEADTPTIQDLARLLDDLAAVYHATPVVAWEDAPDPPEHDYKVSYEHVAARFPTLGLYSVADPLDLETDKTMIGDAIDDIVDIAHELMDVAGCGSRRERMRPAGNIASAMTAIGASICASCAPICTP